jgi:hypothetical protein
MMQETMYRLFFKGEIRWRNIGTMMVGIAFAAIALITFKTHDFWEGRRRAASPRGSETGGGGRSVPVAEADHHRSP